MKRMLCLAALAAALMSLAPMGDALAGGRHDRDRHHHHQHYYDRGYDHRGGRHYHHYDRPPPPPVRYYYYAPPPRPSATIIYRDYGRDPYRDYGRGPSLVRIKPGPDRRRW